MAGIKDGFNFQESNINWLKSAHLTSFTTTVSATDGNEEDVVLSGTIYPANDETAQGIIINDVDVSYGDQEGALMVEGYVLAERLPVQPSQAAIDALEEIKFYTSDNEPFSLT